MRRKECDNSNGWCATEGTRRPLPLALAVVILLVPSFAAQASMIRMWPAAVVNGEEIRVGDICDFSRLPADTPKEWQDAVVAKSPPHGGSRIIHMDRLRTAFRESGANLAKLRIGGALRCVVTRPAEPRQAPDTPLIQQHRASHNNTTETPDEQAAETLRHVVTKALDQSLDYYQGKAEVIFNKDSGFLDLTSPPYEFRIRELGRQPVGLVSLSVDIISEGREPQTVPVVAQVRLVRDVLVAKRGINQGATIGQSDLTRKTMVFTRLRDLGLQDQALAIGQRAKKFIQAGTMIEDDMLESVPLVQRGQLVNVISAAGGIRVVTSGRVATDAKLGESVRVRASNDRRVEFDGVVVGPGEVQIGGLDVTRLTLLPGRRGQ
ncbi:MAG: flagellar basal body P-ring formation chaperone FlgA [Phycisphaerae bacterium]